MNFGQCCCAASLSSSSLGHQVRLLRRRHDLVRSRLLVVSQLNDLRVLVVVVRRDDAPATASSGHRAGQDELCG